MKRTMKKTYIRPVIRTIVLNVHTQILAGSPGVETSTEYADPDGTVLSRRGRGFWDDDED